MIDDRCRSLRASSVVVVPALIAIVIPSSTVAARQRRDRRLLGPLLTRLHRRPRFFAAVVSHDRTAVHLAQKVLRVQGVQIAADGHFGHVQFGGQVGDANRTRRH